jgi:para-aminobenzoate synthetase component 1
MTAPSIIDLAHRKNCLPLLELLSRMPLPVILDSSHFSQDDYASNTLGNENSGDQRYTIVCADPIASLIIEQAISKDNILSKIRALQKKYLSIDEPLSPSLLELPFQGGVAGFLGYPTISKRTELEISTGFLGVYHWAVIVDHQRASTKLAFHPNCSEATREKLNVLTAIDLDKSFTEFDRKPMEKFSLKGKFKPQTDFKNYKQAFEKIKNYILKGDCYQVNLTQKFKASCTGSPFEAFSKLRQACPAPFSAFIQWPGGALISMSPERFIRNQQGRMETKPIKGTRPRGTSADADQKKIKQLVNSIKDKAENLMIVDLLRNDFGRVSKTGSIKATDLFALKTFSNVHHLVSTITGTLKDNYDSIDMLSACFPGGSITGAPKLRAMEIIEEVEGSARGPYCGSVFYWAASGDFDSNITIRTLQWQSASNSAEEVDTIQCWAGGGIVADSDCESEYQECFDKVQHLITTLESL